MSLTSKQRAQLKGIAMNADTIVQVGKGGINDNLITAVASALKARELVKGRVLETCEYSPREVCDILAEKCKAEPVQVIGTKFVLYKRNDKEPKIELVKDKKKE